MTTPYWPAMMLRKTAAAYCELSEAAFEREVASGLQRKNRFNNARYLRDGWKTIRATRDSRPSAALPNDEVTSHGY